VDIMSNGAVLELHGDFDVRSTSEVRNAIYQRLDARVDLVVVDMTDVEAVDVTALKVLAVATLRANRQGHHLVLRGCGPAVRRMLHLSRLAHAVEVERAAATA